jgi:hypothetical protein
MALPLLIGNISGTYLVDSVSPDVSSILEHIVRIIIAKQRNMRHGKRAVRLDCWGENPRLVSYYQRLGYRPCGVVDVNGWQAQLLEKAVQPS